MTSPSLDPRLDVLLSPEARLLLLAARPDDVDAEARALLRGRLAWPRLAWLARVEHAQVALAALLARLGPEVVPVPAILHMQGLADAVRSRMERAEARLEDVVHTLSAAGTEPILLKGAALTRRAYGSMSERPMGDLDLLLAPEEAPVAWRALVEAGWCPEGGDAEARLHRNHHHHLLPLLEPVHRELAVECHTALFRDPVFRVGHEALREGAWSIEWNGGRAWVPAPEHLLLHACLHLAWSNQLRTGAWRTLRDIDTLATGGLDWDRFVRLAREVQGASCAYWPLRMSAALLKAPVPDPTLERLSPFPGGREPRMLARIYAGSLFPGSGRCPHTGLWRRLWTLGVRPEESRHGRFRPWLKGAYAEGLAAGREPAGGLARALNTPLRLGLWAGRTMLATVR